MDGERSNSDVMTISQAGSKKRARPSWTVGLVEEPPTKGPHYLIEGSGDAGTYLYNRIYNDGDQIYWLEQPNKFMTPLNDEAKAAVDRYLMVQRVRDLRRLQAEEIARTPGVVSARATALGDQVAQLEATLAATPETPAPKRKPGPKPRNNEV